MFKSLRALCVALVFALAFGAHALAAGPKTQVPGYYRMQIGQIQVTAVFDGAIDIDTALLHNAAPEELNRLLARMFVGNPKMPTAVNAYVVDTGREVLLIDTGMGGFRGPTLGHIEENLRAAGYEPGQIDKVLLTHIHSDHIGGLTDAAGVARFPKAVVLVAQEEAAYWLSPENAAAAPKGKQPSFALARNMTAPYIASGRWQTFAMGATLAPGVRAEPTVGHTPGHTAYAIESDGQKLLIVGDLLHAHAVQFARPGVSIDFDVDQRKAIATRRAVLKAVAAEGCLMGGMHLPFPGVGHVRAEGEDAYAWVPVEYTPALPAAK
ncbi:MAG TPA: MBL fold metallo-hydrolase [Humidesulfovibrio sp.]|uniref:MBL fold metallo-hydrolase n=1 Tax=Humidesulfovibrio sp. TaxID=2910988 RepID=UPI002BEF4CC0|nr:MBL fold metallo-hydrolase [Humidesulfovibrio sp.]HWR04645.1 MBL fold metallo-hydrolase [Humidesulfovibrio sp.]